MKNTKQYYYYAPRNKVEEITEFAAGGKITEIEGDIQTMKEAIEVSTDKEELAMLNEGLEQLEANLAEEKEKNLYDRNKDMSKGASGEAAKEAKKEKKKNKKADQSNKADTANPKYSDADFDVKEKEGATLVVLKTKKDWIVSIEEKSGKWYSSCCTDDVKHPSQDTKAAAIAQAKNYLFCKSVMEKYRTAAKKKIVQQKEYKKKKGTTNVAMTVEKTVETVHNKVENIKDAGKTISEAQLDNLEKSIIKIVSTIKVAIKDVPDKKEFIKTLIAKLQKLL